MKKPVDVFAGPGTPRLGGILDFMRLLWAVDHGLQEGSAARAASDPSVDHQPPAHLQRGFLTEQRRLARPQAPHDSLQDRADRSQFSARTCQGPAAVDGAPIGTATGRPGRAR